MYICLHLYPDTKFSAPSELGDVTAHRTAVVEGYLPTPSELRNMTARGVPTYPFRIMEHGAPGGTYMYLPPRNRGTVVPQL